jgi:hypothetical protein
MTTHTTKTWIEDGKLITEFIPEAEIYKREWVGLTDREREECQEWLGHHVSSQVFYVIDAMLKEKNT